MGVAASGTHIVNLEFATLKEKMLHTVSPRLKVPLVIPLAVDPLLVNPAQHRLPTDHRNLVYHSDQLLPYDPRRGEIMTVMGELRSGDRPVSLCYLGLDEILNSPISTEVPVVLPFGAVLMHGEPFPVTNRSYCPTHRCSLSSCGRK